MDKQERQNEAEHMYGWFRFTPACLQGLAKGIWVCIVWTIANTLISGTYNGLSGSAQTSIETRFGLSSTQSSWIITSYDIGNMAAGILIAVVASRDSCHKPRWVACGLLVTAVGCIIYTLPHFITDVYMPSDDVYDQDIMCSDKTNSVDTCNDDNEDSGALETSEKFLALFIIARLVLSCGAAPLYLLGLAYMDDCGSKEDFAFYSGIFCCGWIAGPALGFIGGGYALTIFTDFAAVDEEDWLDPDDPRWVGAWWLGFLVSAILMVICAVPVAGFPQDLPGAHEMRLQKSSEAYDSVVNENEVNANKEEDFQPGDLLLYLKYLFTNWTYIFLNLFIACDVGIMAGYTVFGPKLLEVLFNFTSAQASGLLGILVVPSALVGTISGGFLVRKFSLTIIGIMKVQLFLSAIVCIGGLCSILSCPDMPFAGVNVPYHDQGDAGVSEYNLTSACNAECECWHVPFSPVCGGDDVQYYSPCHAGCSADPDGQGEYENCSCPALYNASLSHIAVEGICATSSCNNALIFSLLIFFVMVAIFMTAAMNISGIVRSVPRTHRLLGLVINGIMQKLVGAIPAPIIFGVIFDSSCVLWDENCGERGSCYYFDKNSLGVFIFLTCLGYKLLSIICLLLAWKLYKPPKEIAPLELKITSNKEALGDTIDTKLSSDLSVTDTVMNGKMDFKLSTHL